MPTTPLAAPALAARDMVFNLNVVTYIGHVTIFFLIAVAIGATAIFILFLLVKLFAKEKTHKECIVTAGYLALVMPFTWPYHLYLFIRNLLNRRGKPEDIERDRHGSSASSSTSSAGSAGTAAPAHFTPQRLHSQPVSDDFSRIPSLDISRAASFTPSSIPKLHTSIRSLRNAHVSTGSGHTSDHASVSPILPVFPISRPQSEVQRPVSSIYNLPPPTLCLGEMYFEQERNLVGGENLGSFADEPVKKLLGKPVKECLSEESCFKGERIKSLEAEQVRGSMGTFDTIGL